MFRALFLVGALGGLSIYLFLGMFGFLHIEPKTVAWFTISVFAVAKVMPTKESTLQKQRV